MIEILGYVGALLINIAYLPQVIKTVKTKDIKGLSLLMFIVLLVAEITWITYGVLISNIPTIVCNCVSFIETFIIFVIIIKENGRSIKRSKKTFFIGE